jgi:hypothetical protein
VWDEEAVYKNLAVPPNSWDKATTFNNIIRKIDVSEVDGGPWDPDSIMHYPFSPGMIKEPAKYRTGLKPKGGFSKDDIQWVKTFYPPLNDADNPLLKPKVPFFGDMQPGVQWNFLVSPDKSGPRTFQTIGASDTVCPPPPFLSIKFIQTLSPAFCYATISSFLIVGPILRVRHLTNIHICGPAAYHWLLHSLCCSSCSRMCADQSTLTWLQQPCSSQ